ncbi:hypothetical protein ABBQ38_005799 [Trebouxia sp. C0009 RCD-2024]
MSMVAHLGRCSQTASKHAHQALAGHTRRHSTLRDGQSFTRKHSGFQASDVQVWAALTGDTNPLHVCEVAAKDAGFGGAVLPGMLCASLFPAIIGSQFPGALYLTQTLNFRQPALVRCVLLKVQPLPSGSPLLLGNLPPCELAVTGPPEKSGFRLSFSSDG